MFISGTVTVSTGHSKAAGPGEETDGFAFVPPYMPTSGVNMSGRRTEGSDRASVSSLSGFFAAMSSFQSESIFCFGRAVENGHLDISR